MRELVYKLWTTAPKKLWDAEKFRRWRWQLLSRRHLSFCVIVLDPEKTFKLLDWIKHGGNQILDCKYENLHDFYSHGQQYADLEKMFPSLWDHEDRLDDNDHAGVLVARAYDKVISAQFKVSGDWQNEYALGEGENDLGGFFGDHNFSVPTAFVKKGSPQQVLKEVQNLFNGSVAVFRIEVPSYRYGATVRFITESEHVSPDDPDTCVSADFICGHRAVLSFKR